MDPNNSGNNNDGDDDNKGSNKNNINRDPQDRTREFERRLRLARLGDQQQEQQRGGGGGARVGGFIRNPGVDAEDTSSSTNNINREARADSKMGNRRSRTESAADPPAAAAAGGAAGGAASARDDDRDGNSGTANPRLREFVQHLKEFCRDGDRKSPHSSAINMEKARNVLEACAGNLALAGQVYWDDYFASQQQEQGGLDAPSAAGAAAAEEAVAAPAADPDDEERRVRRRLESDFERLLPAAPPLAENNINNNPPEPEAEPAAAVPAARSSRRRRRRRRGGPEVAFAVAEAGGGDQQAAGAAVRNNVEEENVPIADADQQPPAARPAGAAAAAAPAHRRRQDNQALLVAARAVLGAGGGEDAGEGSVSVSDDEAGVAGVLRMVRESGRARLRGRRRRRSSFEDDAKSSSAAEGEEDTEAARQTKKRKVSAGGGGGGGGDSSDDDDDDDSKSDKVGNDNNIDKDDDEDAYLSDNDWLFRSPESRDREANDGGPPPQGGATSQPVENLRAPRKVLWNGLSISLEGAGKTNTKNEPKKEKSDGDAKKEDLDGENHDDTPAPGTGKRPEIPSTWLHASFSSHSTAMGLAIKDPKPEDVAEHSWRLQQISNENSSSNNRRNNSIPLPYHCRGITAVLSVVTAAIYTGASVQSNQVTCSSSRVPFMELSEEQRKREFESRLIDALSAFIFVAATASMERKKKALAKRQARKSRKRKRQTKKKDTEEDSAKPPNSLKKNLERKLKLCPVVWWKESQQNTPMLPSDQWENSLDGDNAHTGPRIQLSVTYGTNIEDIRAFVLSNLQSFTAPGGIALFLECILDIHGEGAVKSMLRKCCQSTKKDHCFLVRCTCEGRQKKRLQDKSLSPASRRKMTNSLDTTPPGHGCVSTELISLLLTGKVHSSLKGWTAGPLGFGFMSNNPGEVGRPLSRPELPVWVVKGETCYSVLFLDHTNHGDNLDEKVAASTSTTGNGKGKAGEKKKSLSPSKPKAAPCMKIAMCSSTSRSRDLQEAQAFANKDQPGSIANMQHWNCWYGLRNSSGLRLITARPKWTPPAPSWVLANYKSAPDAKPVESLTCSRKSVKEQLKESRAFQTNVVSSDERENAELEQPVDEAALDRVRENPDDAKFYPKQYRLWRFDFGEREGARADPNSKPRGDHWVPYYSLSHEEQMLVETKFGPQINRIIWTRWPGATIDKFSPALPLPIV